MLWSRSWDLGDEEGRAQGLQQGVGVDVLRACWPCPGAPGGGEGTDGRAQGQIRRGCSRMQWGPAWP